MEGAPLRPVPFPPPGPIAPAEAVRYVTGELPELDEAAAAAFALVALVGRPRPEVGVSSDSAEATELSGDALADALARARKALRRKLYPLPGSGWCERAERLISDRLDDALEHPGPARLEAHLGNCGRCVEHERRLGQAQDALVAGFVEAHPAKEPESESPPAPADVETPPLPPALRVVDTPILLPPASEPDALPAPVVASDALPDPASPAGHSNAVPEPATPPTPPAPSNAVPEPATPPTPPAPSNAVPEPATPPTPPAESNALPMPAAAPSAAVPEPATPPTPPAPSNAAPEPATPPTPAAPAAARAPAARAATWTPAPWTASPAAPWTPAPPRPGPEPWRTGTARPPLAARTALENEDIWASIGPLVAVLSAALVIFVLAGLLAVGG